MTYENGGGVNASEDGERANADDIVVEQRGTRLISFDGFLKIEIAGNDTGVSSRYKSECADSDTMNTRGEALTGRGCRWQWTLQRQ